MRDKKRYFRKVINVFHIITNIGSYSRRWGEYLLRKDGSRIENVDFEYNPKAEEM